MTAELVGLDPARFATNEWEALQQQIATLNRRASYAERTAGFIGNGTINGGAGGHITPTSITTASIVAGGIDADRLTSGTVTTTQLYAGGVDALKIQTANLAAGSVTASTINVTTLSAITANLGTITAGTLTGTTFQTSASNPRVVLDGAGLRAYNAAGQLKVAVDSTTGLITAQGVITADPGSNLPVAVLTGNLPGANTVFNSRGEAAATTAPDWTNFNGTLVTVAGGRSGSKSFRLTAGFLGALDLYQGHSTTRTAKAVAGETWSGSAYVRAATTGRTVSIYVGFRDAAGTLLASTTGASIVDSAAAWQRVTAKATAPANTAYVYVAIEWLAVPAAEVHDATDIQLEQGDVPSSYAPRPDEILPAAVGSTELATDSVIAAKIAAGAVVAGKIAALSVTATELAAGSVVASKISVASLAAITADLGTVTAGNINGLTITGGLIRTAASGARVELTSAGLTVWQDATTISVNLPADASTQPYFAGKILASGGLEVNATSSYPAPSTAKLRGRDPITFAERGALLTTLNGYSNAIGGHMGASGVSGTQAAAGAVRAQAQAGSAYRAVVLADAPWGYWRLDAYPSSDESGNARTAVDNSYGTTPGPVGSLVTGGGGALSLGDASNQGGLFLGEPAPNLGFVPAGNFTVELWFKKVSAQATQIVLCGNRNQNDLRVTIESGNYKVRATIGGTLRTITTSTAPSADRDHLWLEYDGTTLRFYVNNVLAGSVAATGALATLNEGLNIGLASLAESYTPGLNGGIFDELALYTTVPAAARRTDHYQTGLTGVSTSSTVREVMLLDSDGRSQIPLEWTWNLGAVSSLVIDSTKIPGGLDGNNDLAYELIYHVRYTSVGGADRTITLRPNADAAANYQNIEHLIYSATSHTVLAGATTGLEIGHTHFNEAGAVVGEALLGAKAFGASTVSRLCIASYGFTSQATATNMARNEVVGRWNNVTSNIVSLTIDFAVAISEGVVTLRRKRLAA